MKQLDGNNTGKAQVLTQMIENTAETEPKDQQPCQPLPPLEEPAEMTRVNHKRNC